jgi:hypothetical protein
VTVPVTTRVTDSMLSRIDKLASDLHLTRGSTVTLLLAAALQHERTLLGSFRTLRNRGGRR